MPTRPESNFFECISSAGNSSEQAFLRNNYLSGAALNMIGPMRQQMKEELVKSGVLGCLFGGKLPVDALLADASRNASCTPLVLTVLAAGLYPQIATAVSEGAGSKGKSSLKIELRHHKKGVLHPSCVGCTMEREVMDTSQVEYLAFDEMSKVRCQAQDLLLPMWTLHTLFLHCRSGHSAT
jgi:hypothetical protein